MSSGRADTGQPTFLELALDLAWSVWTELGVPGTTSRHGEWAIDPEPLILFTAFLDDADRRLRDEATAWCIRHSAIVSKARLRTLLRASPPSVRDPFGPMAATIEQAAGSAWPGASEARTFRLPKSAGTERLEVHRPSAGWLRLRDVVGVNARAEILRFFLAGPEIVTGTAELAHAIGFTKRNVADECRSLARSGVLGIRTIRNRNYYSLARRQPLLDLIGGVAPIRPDWTALLDLVRELVSVEREITAPEALAATRPMKARRALDAMEVALDRLGLPGAGQGGRGAELWPAVQDLGGRTLGEWTVGRWGGVRFD